MNTEDFSSYPKTRKEAMVLGVNRYFTGNPCPQGHITLRKTKEGCCVECSREKWREYDKKRKATDPEYALRMKESSTKRIMERYYSDPEFREKMKKDAYSRQKERYVKNPDYKKDCRAKNAEYLRLRKQNEPEYKEKMYAQTRAWFRNKKATDPEYVEKFAEYMKQHYKNNDAFRARNQLSAANGNKERAKRRIRLWPEYEQELIEIYAERNRLNKEHKKDGIEYAVDHIVPALGKFVSGLTVPWNLRIIERKHNREKGNKYFEEPEPYGVF